MAEALGMIETRGFAAVEIIGNPAATEPAARAAPPFRNFRRLAEAPMSPESPGLLSVSDRCCIFFIFISSGVV